MNLFYCPEYSLPEGDDTVTKARLVADLVRSAPELDVELRRPQPVTREELLQIHDAGYVDAVLSGRLTQLPPGPWSPALLESLLHSTGGMRDAVQEALVAGVAGSLSTGMHHASRARGWALCTFNGVALAALTALRAVPTVGVLDTDAHFGGGTFAILGGDPRVRICDVGVADLDEWEPSDPSRHLRVHVTDPRRYLAAVRQALRRLEGVGFLVYDAGMDTHEAAGGIPGLTTEVIREREELVAGWARRRGVPVIFALEGGYTVPLTLPELAALHLETVRAFARRR